MSYQAVLVSETPLKIVARSSTHVSRMFFVSSACCVFGVNSYMDTYVSICICKSIHVNPYTYVCMYVCMYVCTYACIYIHTYAYTSRICTGVCRRGVSRPAPRALCYIPVVTATCYTPPVADLSFSTKPCVKVATLENLVTKTHMKRNLYQCQWSRWLAKAILMQNILHRWRYATGM